MSGRHPVAAYRLPPGLGLLLHDAGISGRNVLKRAGLPQATFADRTLALTPTDYFGLWRAIEEEAEDPLLPVHVAKSFSVETFDPLVFAALCSSDLNVACSRVAAFKQLAGPVRLHVLVDDDRTEVEFEWPPGDPPPASLAVAELAFVLELARRATRHDVAALHVTTVEPPSGAQLFTNFFGVHLEQGTRHTITISADDARRPFVTVNEPMWSSFEPQLRIRLAELTGATTAAEKVRATLVELLPSGTSSMNDVACALATSTRSLQRQLRAEGTTYQEILGQTRAALARHYLAEGSTSIAEIALLLGYQEPRSFQRAFVDWTGQTPHSFRHRTQQPASSP